MSSTRPFDSVFIGWDVGGWNCDHNPNSRDAIVILNSQMAVLGRPWRGNLSACINESDDTRAFVRNLLKLCAVDHLAKDTSITLAIDTPLGFSRAFVELVTHLYAAQPGERHETNPYLFRQTERFLFTLGLKPLSAVKDMIGSQATKAMHVLARFTPRLENCGVWSDGKLLTAIEAYPAACNGSACIADNLRQVRNPPNLHQDEQDALACALIAYLFKEQPELLIHPGDDVPQSEGWIWVPKDIVKRSGP